MPDMGYIPQIPNFQLPGPAQITQQPGLAQGLASGLQGGAQMGLNLQQARAQGLANQITQYQMSPEIRALAVQQTQAAIAKQQAEAKKIQQDNGLGLMKAAAEGYDRWGDDAGPELFNTFKKGVDMVAPGSIPDDWQFTPDMGGVMKQAGKAVDALQAGDATLEDTMYFLSKLKAKASKVQQERLQGVLTPVQNMYDQEQTRKRTEFTQGQESQRKALDENDKYKASVTPFVNAHKSFQQMQNIVNQSQKAGTDVDPWSFLNSYVHAIDPNFNGVINAQTYKDLQVSGSPILSSIPGGETLLTTSKIDPKDAMRMLQIAKSQDKLHSKTVSDYADMTKRHIQNLGGDPTMVQDFFQGQQVKTITNANDHNSLPKGSHYLDVNGKEWVKN
jgi:hypothetical protein